METSIEKLLEMKVNNQDESDFWNILFLFMEDDKLKNFKFLHCRTCGAQFDFFMLNKLNLKNKIKEENWNVNVLSIFKEIISIHDMVWKCGSVKADFFNHKKELLIMYESALSRQKTIKKILIIDEDNPYYKEKYIEIEKNNNDLDLLWNKGEYDEVIETIKDSKDVAVKNLFNLKGDGAIKKFFDKKMEKSKFKEDGLIWKEINNIFISLSKMRNKFFKKSKRETGDVQYQEEVFSWEKLSEDDKKTLSRLLLDIYFVGQNFLYLKKDE